MAVAGRSAEDRAGAGPDAAPRPPALGQAYAAGDPRTLALFAGNPLSRQDRLAAVDRARAFRRDRGVLADVLAEQNATWAAPSDAVASVVAAGVEALRDPDTVAVVTGQQLGLFGGPLFTLHKALTAVRLARRLADETGAAVVPVFWMADEDHDFSEVRWAAFPAGERVVRLAYDDGLPADANRGPVGRIALGPGISRLVDELRAALPGGPFGAQLLAAVEAAWAPGERWRDAFARTLRTLLPDAPLVFLSADDTRVKALAADVLREEAAAWSATHAAHAERTAEVEALGYAAQVSPRPVHVFLLEDGRRLALDPANESAPEAGVVVRADGRVLSRDELVRLATRQPGSLSPDVVLRPVIQDALLPTAAYVAGPGETAYFAQLGGVYRRFDVPMPLIAQRASLTLVEPAIRRSLDALGLVVADLADDPAALATKVALRTEAPDLDASLAKAEREAEEALGAAAATAAALDASLAAAGAAALARTRRAMEALRKKAERVARRRASDATSRLERARAALRPAGVPQERALSALALYARYGPGLARLIEESVDVDAPGHRVVELP